MDFSQNARKPVILIQFEKQQFRLYLRLKEACFLSDLKSKTMVSVILPL